MASRTELFLDDRLLEVSASVTRRICQPRKHRLNPVFRCERWWEARCIMPLATLYDKEEKLFKMWYRTGPVHYKEPRIDGHASYSAYATSTDGVNWDRPNLGVMELAGRRDHSVVLTGGASEGLAAGGKKGVILSVVLHPHPKDEGEKYVCLFFDNADRGAFIGYSPDGIHWRREPKPFWRTPIDWTDWGDDNIMMLMYDKFQQQWVVYRRVVPEESERLVGIPSDANLKVPGRLLRVMSRAESQDLKTWRNHRMLMIPDGDDPADIDFYGLSVYNYEQVYVGYLWVYHQAPERHNIDAQLVTSRNGSDFTRCCRREVYLPSGAREMFDYEITVGYQAEPIVVNDQVYLYYEACNYDHGPDHSDALREHTMVTGGLATFPRDRFVGLQTGLPQPCTVVTKPFVLEHPKLFINAGTWADGSIVTEVLTRDWKPVAGFTKAEALPISGNALAHPVRWKTHDSVAELAGREVRLKFHMTHAVLHALIEETEERPLGELPPMRPYETLWSSAVQGPADSAGI